LLFTGGCAKRPSENKPILASINDYTITKDEFEEKFRNSPYATSDSAESRAAFLNNLINRKLVLQDAHKKGLDADPAFLKSVESFWEQSLLKLTLNKKSQEVAASTQVSDAEVREAYDAMAKDSTAKQPPYEEIYAQLKRDIMRHKESKTMNDWIISLRKEAAIKVNKTLLKGDK
jgi:peptidyl-prolyl cis-trans isomerase C